MLPVSYTNVNTLLHYAYITKDATLKEFHKFYLQHTLLYTGLPVLQLWEILSSYLHNCVINTILQ